jgi:hypothetical protein
MENNCNVEIRSKSFKELIKSWYFWKPALGIIIGGVGGFLFYKFVGCSSGSCGITSSPYMSTIWGALSGWFLSRGGCCGR